ncbi:class II aldolase/adducin family protein [Sulfuriroseicoccus oceanibius]|uniref:Class II aldolase/adducin family protein n=1 Tax=Sulfuriroseicoccus oceanibius TaxID=2707525 RepID=A0A6B3LAU6_9BACT|nr:class II aldolase/adducin family protein [Sulfuriroseicoccus oceanibius]QQL44562.1 class II aldolase/adducin family protein [Sulfuriroseicoccus oceanibius]
MKKVFTERDIQQMLRSGMSLDTIPAGAVLTPSARDAIRAAGKQAPAYASGQGIKSAPSAADRFPPLPPGVPTVPPEPIVPSFEYHWPAGQDPQTPEEIQRFFYSPEIQKLKEAIVHVGHKMWMRNMVDGNGGNITVRVGDNLVLCTPTLRSKGELVADDIALVDLDGNQKAGWRKRTSEANTHLAIMKLQPKAKSVIHGHPPYSTAYAVAGIEPPTCLCSEAEIFTGPIRLVPYQTPGSPENASAVAEIGKDNPAILLANHGVMTWGTDVEDAYWKLENMETACQTVWVASQLNGGKLQRIPSDKMQDIFDIRRSIGMEDPREGMKECELCHDDFRPGTFTAISPAMVDDSADFVPDAEALVKRITDEIMAAKK